jgi:heavy metal translocating P-type ATPase
MVATGVAAKFGILFKGGDVLERCKQVRTVVFDKTGTLTFGKPAVQRCWISPSLSEQQQQQFATVLSLCESRSEHVLARAVVEYVNANLDDRSSSKPAQMMTTLTAFEIVAGRGLSATLEDGRSVLVGSYQWLQSNGVAAIAFDRELSAMQDEGLTTVWMAVERTVWGVLGLADQIRPEAALVVSELQRKGYDVWMLSGDNRKAAMRVARQLSIASDHVVAEVLPIEKSQHVKQLQQQQSNVVAMVGDGLNDAVSLTQADVGIALSSGTDISIEAAGVVLMRNDLCDLLTMFDLSKTSFNLIRINFGWAFLYNLLGIPFASGVLYPLIHWAIQPGFAGLSELFSSVPVILISLTLYRYRPPNWRAASV